MKIVIVTFGSRGDVQPLLALALHLKKSGHSVILCGPPDFESWVQGFGCTYLTIDTPLSGVMELFSQWARVPWELHYISEFTRIFRNFNEKCFKVLPAVVHDADLVLGSSMIVCAKTVAELYGVPYYFISYGPQNIPSEYYPSLYIPNYFGSRRFNRFTWMVMQAGENMMYKKLINKKRKELNLNPISHAYRHKLGDTVIIAADEILASPAPDCRYNYFQTGYFQMQQNEEMSDEVKSFLASGPKPIYVGFGSMTSGDPESFSRLFMDATSSGNHRIIFYGGAAKLRNIYNDKRCLVTDDVPHTKLFPHMSLIIHHGGAGTTATASRSGNPQLIIPHFLDQFFWANRIEKTGIGKHVGWKQRLTVEELSRKIDECLKSSEIAEKAREVSFKLNGHDSFYEFERYLEAKYSKHIKIKKTEMSINYIKEAAALR